MESTLVEPDASLRQYRTSGNTGSLG